jgi:hypothetical protein
MPYTQKMLPFALDGRTRNVRDAEFPPEDISRAINDLKDRW